MLECHLTMEEALPLVCLCCLLSFLCGVGIGGNDLSANFAMVVGSGSLNMKQAIYYCVAFELLGAYFMGGKVSNTIRTGIVDPILFQRSPEMVVGGMTCATLSASLWLYLSTVFGLPVSITHTVVGSVLGFAIFSVGSFDYVLVSGIEKIVISWLMAPVLAAIVTAIIFYWMKHHVMDGHGSFERAAKALPYCMFLSLFIDVCFLFIEEPPLLRRTLVESLPFPLPFLALTTFVAGLSWWANSYVFPKTVHAARDQTEFVWESETVTTRAAAQPTDAKAKSSESNLISSFVGFAADTESVGTSVSEDHSQPVTRSGAYQVSSFYDGGGATLDSHNSVRNVQIVPSTSTGGAAVLARRSSFLRAQMRSNSLVGTMDGSASRKLCSFDDIPTASEGKAAAAAVPTAETALAAPSKRVTYGTVTMHSPVAQQPSADSDMNPFDVNSSDDEGDQIACHMKHIRYGDIDVRHFNPKSEFLFTVLQVVAGAMSSFVHGAVAGANATATFMILYETFILHYLKDPDLDNISGRWSILPAMLGITIGMYSLGARLMKTVGVDLVTVTPARGWTMQVGGTMVTMICTGLGIPVSLSQCQIGAAIGCGVTDAGGNLAGVSWGVVLKIIAGWIITLVIGSLTTGLTMRLMSTYYCGSGPSSHAPIASLAPK